jgi:hypothetical protein
VFTSAVFPEVNPGNGGFPATNSMNIAHILSLFLVNGVCSGRNQILMVEKSRTWGFWAS